MSDGMDKEFLAWLKSMGPKPPNAKEIERMGRAITADLQRWHDRGVSAEVRLKTFSDLGYLYEGLVYELPKG